MGKDAIRMHRLRFQKRIRTEIFSRKRRRDDGVYLPGHAFQPACLEMVFEPIHDTQTPPIRCQCRDGLIKRKYRMAGKKVCAPQLLFGVHMGKFISCTAAKRQQSRGRLS